MLIIVWYGDRTSTQHEVSNLFIIKHPNISITPTTVSKIEKTFGDTGHVKYVANPSRPPIYDNVKLDIFLSAENLQITTFLKGLFYIY